MHPIDTSIKISDYVTSGTPRINKKDTRMDLPKKEHQGNNNHSNTTTYSDTKKIKKTTEEGKGNKIDIYI